MRRKIPRRKNKIYRIDDDGLSVSLFQNVSRGRRERTLLVGIAYVTITLLVVTMLTAMFFPLAALAIIDNILNLI